MWLPSLGLAFQKSSSHERSKALVEVRPLYSEAPRDSACVDLLACVRKRVSANRIHQLRHVKVVFAPPIIEPQQTVGVFRSGQSLSRPAVDSAKRALQPSAGTRLYSCERF